MSSNKQLFAASAAGDVARITEIVSTEDNVDLEYREEYQYTSLIIAAEYGHSAVVRVLLALDADPNSVNMWGLTALHWASTGGCQDSVAALLQQPYTQVNIQDNYGNTPLHWACMNGHLKIVELLLKAGANNQLKNSDGQLPVDKLDISNEHSPTITALLDDATPKSTGAKPTAPPKAESKSQIKSKASTAVKPKAMQSKVGAKPKSRQLRKSRQLSKGESSQLIKRINNDVTMLTSTLKNSITKLEKQIEVLTVQITNKDAAIARKDSNLEQKDVQISQVMKQLQALRNMIESLKHEVQTKSEELSKGINHLMTRSNEYYASNCQDNNLSEVIFFKVFQTIADKIHYQHVTWLQLGHALFVNFPDAFVTPLMDKIRSNHDTEKDRLLELLIHWKMYCYNTDGNTKLQGLKAALRGLISATDATALDKKIDDILTEHGQKSHQQNKGSLTDRGLDALAGQIKSEWHSLGLELEFTDAELYHFEEDFPAAKRRNLQMLISWRNRETGFTHMKTGRLAEALIQCGRTDLAKGLQ